LRLYYYKDEANQDEGVSVPTMLKMFEQLSTPASLKVKQALPSAGDHVIGSYIKSKDVAGVEQAITNYMVNILQLKLNAN